MYDREAVACIAPPDSDSISSSSSSAKLYQCVNGRISHTRTSQSARTHQSARRKSSPNKSNAIVIKQASPRGIQRGPPRPRSLNLSKVIKRLTTPIKIRGAPPLPYPGSPSTVSHLTSKACASSPTPRNLPSGPRPPSSDAEAASRSPPKPIQR